MDFNNNETKDEKKEKDEIKISKNEKKEVNITKPKAKKVKFDRCISGYLKGFGGFSYQPNIEYEIAIEIFDYLKSLKSIDIEEI